MIMNRYNLKNIVSKIFSRNNVEYHETDDKFSGDRAFTKGLSVTVNFANLVPVNNFVPNSFKDKLTFVSDKQIVDTLVSVFHELRHVEIDPRLKQLAIRKRFDKDLVKLVQREKVNEIDFYEYDRQDNFLSY